MIDYVQRLGDRVTDAWRAHDYDLDRLPELALEALREDPPHRHVDVTAILRWLATTTQLPPQPSLASRFGEAGVELYIGGDNRLLIQALFWIDGTTSIHEHAFAGAFAVLAGSSVHSEFRFAVEDRLGPGVRIGELEHRHSELLERGDVRAIRPALVHSLFHLERPSVTIVVRSIGAPGHTQQLDYRRPHVAIDRALIAPAVRRRIAALQMLAQLDAAEHDRVLQEMLACACASEAYVLLDAAIDDRLLRAPRSEHHAWLDRQLAVARARHPRLDDRIAAVFHERLRESQIIALRERVHDAELRFFLALLLNVPRRDLVLRLIERRHPGADPRDTVVRLVRALLAHRSDRDPPDDATLVLVRCLLDGLGLAAIRRRLQETSSDWSDDEIARRCSSVRASPIFAPLFTD